MIYVVKSGDTLYKIAQQIVGDGNRYRELLSGNPQITDPNYIEVGDMLNIPDSWGGSSGSSQTVSQPIEIVDESAGMSANAKVILVALLAAGAAAAYWYFGKVHAEAQANPMGDTGDDITDPENEYQGGA